MIAAHQTMMGPQGAPLPYDAEVEYLESTGTQYIDTGVDTSTTVNAYIKFATTITSGTTAYTLWGARVGSGNRSMLNLQYWSGSRQQFRWDYSNDVKPFSATVNSSIHEFQTASNKCTLDGTETQTASGSTLQALHVYVFGLNQNGSATMLHAGLRVYAFQLTDGGVLSRDFIPVRVGTTGYLYDRVNPTGGPLGNGLYGNAGTGNFTVGPDK